MKPDLTLIAAYRSLGPDGRVLELATAKKVRQELEDIDNRAADTRYQAKSGLIYTVDRLTGKEVFFTDGTKLLVAGRE